MGFNDHFPILDSVRSELVDAQGNPAHGPARPGLFAARPAIPAHFAGIELAPALCRELGYADEENKATPLGAGYFAPLEQKFFQAVRILSQTDLGVDLLSKAHAAGTQFKFDDPQMRERKALGTHSSTENLISFGTYGTVELLALVIAHELEHARHYLGGLNYSPWDSLAANVHKSRVREAASMAVVGVVAYQSFLGTPAYKPGDFEANGILQVFHKTYPVQAGQAAKHADKARQGNWTEFAGKLFEATGKDAAYNSDYDHQDMMIADDVLSPHRLKNPGLITPGMAPFDRDKVLGQKAPDPDTIASALTLCGHPYVDPDILKTRAFRTLTPSPKVNQEYSQFRKRARQLNDEFGYSIDPDVPQAAFLHRAGLSTLNISDKYDEFTRRPAVVLGMALSGVLGIAMLKELARPATPEQHEDELFYAAAVLKVDVDNVVNHAQGTIPAKEIRKVINDDGTLLLIARPGDEATLKTAAAILANLETGAPLSPDAKTALDDEITANESEQRDFTAYTSSKPALKSFGP